LYRLLVKLEVLGWGEEISKMLSYDLSKMYHTFLKNYELGSFAQG
jgi:hypothetical protein